MRGVTLNGVQVDLFGPAARSGNTSTSGQLNFLTLPAGTYRLRFSGADVTTFEREVTLAATKTNSLEVSLSPAPPPREIVKEVPAPAPEPVKIAAVGPSGNPLALSLYDLAEKELKAKQPRRDILIACSGNLRSQVVFFTGKDDQPQRLYDAAEASYYVLGGEALISVAGKDHVLVAGGYVSIPRGVPFAIARRGSKPLSLLSLLSGAPCEEAR